MSVLALIIILCFLGLLGWFVNSKLPITPGFKMLINAVLMVIAAILVLYAFGVWDQVKGVKVPRL